MVFFLSRFQDYIYIILNIMETALLTFLFTSHLYPFWVLELSFFCIEP